MKLIDGIEYLRSLDERLGALERVHALLLTEPAREDDAHIIKTILQEVRKEHEDVYRKIKTMFGGMSE